MTTPCAPSAPAKDGFKPCPFCGSSNIDPTGVASMTPGQREVAYAPACSDCDATTNGDWNSRVDASELAKARAQIASLQAQLVHHEAAVGSWMNIAERANIRIAALTAANEEMRALLKRWSACPEVTECAEEDRDSDTETVWREARAALASSSVDGEKV